MINEIKNVLVGQPKSTQALYVNIDSADSTNINIVVGNKIITIARSKILNETSIPKIEKKTVKSGFTQQLILMGGGNPTNPPIPTITQRPCPITYTVFTLDADNNVDFNII